MGGGTTHDVDDNLLHYWAVLILLRAFRFRFCGILYRWSSGVRRGSSLSYQRSVRLLPPPPPQLAPPAYAHVLTHACTPRQPDRAIACDVFGCCVRADAAIDEWQTEMQLRADRATDGNLYARASSATTAAICIGSITCLLYVLGARAPVLLCLGC